MKKWKSTDKPGSVVDSHSSGIRIAAYLVRPTRGQYGPHFLIRRSMSPYLVLLQVGFTLPHMLPCARCALTAPFQPYLCRERPSAVSFLLHFPSSRDARALPGTLPCGARTFLRRTNPTAILTRHAHQEDDSGGPPFVSPTRRPHRAAVSSRP